MCKHSYLRMCIYSYFAQMYKMNLKNQLQMTTFFGAVEIQWGRTF